MKFKIESSHSRGWHSVFSTQWGILWQGILFFTSARDMIYVHCPPLYIVYIVYCVYVVKDLCKICIVQYLLDLTQMSPISLFILFTIFLYSPNLYFPKHLLLISIFLSFYVFIFGILWLVDVVDDNICRPFLQPIALTRQLGIVNSQK